MRGRFYILLFLAVFTPFFASAATTYTFSSGFSTTQGANQWSYYQLQGSTYTPMTWDAAASVWRGVDGGFPFIGANGSRHPGNASDAVIRWTAPASGTVNITGTVADTDGTCGDGIAASILKNGTTLWSATLENGDTTGKTHSVAENVSSGDTISFIINRRANYSCDSTGWNPTITHQVIQVSGSLDGLTSTSAVGWTLNSGDYSQATVARFYINAPYDQGGVLLGTVTTNQPRPDLGVPGNHGFTFTIPDQYLDGASHTVYAYGVESDGSLTHLQTSPKTATFACGAGCANNFPAQLSILPHSGDIRVEAVGSLETVFRSKNSPPGQGCYSEDFPDIMAHAFRGAGGVNLLAVNGGPAYRSTGSTLNAATSRQCASPIYTPALDPDYYDIQDHEWISGVYTTDGTNIYALVHNEDHRGCSPTRDDSHYSESAVFSISLIVSNDGGAHFYHPSDYKVRIPPVPWSPSFPCDGSLNFGSMEPSNIVGKSDGYYYSTFMFTPDPNALSGGRTKGMCLMRTNDLAHGSSWRVWMGRTNPGNPWQSAVDTPYCDVLSPDTLMGGGQPEQMKSLSYNDYLHSWMATTAGFGIPGGGYGYSLSQDLINWTVPVGLVAGVLSNAPYETLIYPSLLDPTDTRPSFDHSGPEPYLYFIHYPNFNLVRQQIKFTDLRPPPASPCTFNGTSVASGQSVTAYQSSTVPYSNQCVSEQRSCSNGTLSGSYTNVSCSVGAAAPCTFNGQTISNSSSVTAYQSSSVLFGQQCVAQTRACTNGTLSGSYTYGACSVGGAASCTLDSVPVAHNVSQTFYSSKTVPWGSLCSAVSQSRTCANGTLSGDASYQYGTCAPGAANSCAFNNQSVTHGATVTAYQSSSVPFGAQCVAQSRPCSNGTLSGSYQYLACVAGTTSSCTWNGQSVAHGTNVTAYQLPSVAFGSSCLSQTRLCTNGTLSGSYAYVSCSANAPTSCTFNNQSIAHGSTVTAYQSSSVASGSTCTAQSRACANGTLNGSYQNASCTVAGSTCTPNWSCASWNRCSVSGNQSRTCTDTNACGMTTGKPAEAQSCTYSGGDGTDPTIAQRIAALLAQIQQLQALLAKLKGGTTSVSTPTPTTTTVTYNGTCPVISRTLSRGASGADVTALQKFFMTQYKDYTTKYVTGLFGPITEAALKQWQGEHGIERTGMLGPKTRAAIAGCK